MPSCYNCRKRRIVCDQGEPQCRKCQTKGIQCSGPNAPKPFKFINQTERVINHHRERFHSPASKSDDSSSGTSRSHGRVPPVPQTLFVDQNYLYVTHGGSEPVSAQGRGIRPQMNGRRRAAAKQPANRPSSRETSPTVATPTANRSIVEIACQQFLAGYSYLNRNLGAIDPLYELIGKVSEDLQDDMSSKGCKAALEAISLAHMGIQNRSEKVLALARNRYCNSLGYLRLALEKSRPKDIARLLMAVRLCTGYEFMVCGNPFETGWGRHMEGQLSLARAIMPYLGVDGTNRSLFLAAFFSVAIVRAYARTPCSLRKEDITSVFNDFDDLEVALSLLSVDVIDLRAKATVLTREPPKERSMKAARRLLREAEHVASELRSWGLVFKSQHPWQAVEVQYTIDDRMLDEAEIWPGIVTSHNSLHEANLHNLHQSWTIYCHAAIIQIQTWLRTHPDICSPPWAEANYDFDMIHKAINSICADSAYYLGLRNRPPSMSQETVNSLSLKGGGHSSYWFWLATAAGVEVIDPRQRSWILGRLRFIGDIYGHRWASFISRHPPTDIILGKIDDERRMAYKSIPGWPKADETAESIDLQTPYVDEFLPRAQKRATAEDADDDGDGDY